ncbi:MAG: extracellular substrate binding-like orphan protein GrrP [Synechocystis sp.]
MVAGAKTAIAETVMEKVARTGTLTLGVNLNDVPLSYVNDKDEVVGFSVDVAERIREEVTRELGKDVTLQVVEVQDISDAIPKIENGEVDLVCGVGFTWERDRYVDFTVSYAASGMQLLVSKQAALTSAADLVGKKIAVVPNTIAEDTIKLVQSKVQLVPIKSLQAGLELFRDGKVEAVAGDGLQMDGLRQVLGLKETKLVPESPQVYNGVSCMMREYNPAFLRLANYALVKLAEGYYFGDPEDVALVNKWIGPEGVVQVKPENIKRFFQYISITHEQIPEGLKNPAQPKP